MPKRALIDASRWCLVLVALSAVTCHAFEPPSTALSSPAVVQQRASSNAPVTTARRYEAPSGRAIGELTPKDCRGWLRRLHIRHEQLSSDEFPKVATPIRLSGPVRGVEFVFRGRNPLHEVLDCRLAVALWHWAGILRTEGIVRVMHFSLLRAEARVRGTRQVSGHARGLAIDAGIFEQRDGEVARVLEHWRERQRGSAPCDDYAGETSQANLLRRIVCAAVDADLFQTVITPHHDRTHADHVHLEVVPGVDWSFVR